MGEDLTRKLGAAAPVRGWLTEPLTPEVAAAITRLSRAPDVHRIALMPDVHLGEGSCVGVVLATSSLIYPQAIGADIGCGFTAIPLNADRALLDDPDARRLALTALARAVPILRHPSIASIPPPECDADQLGTPALRTRARRDGRIEFATLGRGNHFLEIQSDEHDRLWLAVHSGSRAMGQHITRTHLAHATRVAGGFLRLDASTPGGQSYLHDMQWAIRYAAASRLAMLTHATHALSSALDAVLTPGNPVGSDHNHAAFETHDDARLLVHRKGASRAGIDDSYMIPGSMAAPTFHVRGLGCPASLRSSSHGAGRALSRSQAHRVISPLAFLNAPHLPTFDRRNAARLVDEAPAAYRDIRRVMRAQRDLVRVARTLTPLVCLKGV